MEVLSSGHTLVEGPRWHDGALWFSDMHDHSVWRVRPGEPAERLIEIDDATSGLGFLPDGDVLIVGMHERMVHRWNPTDGVRPWVDLSTIATYHANDLIVLPGGITLVGNFGDDSAPPAPPHAAPLARIAPDGTVSAVAENLDFANGMAVIGGGHTLVVAETRATPPRLTAFRLHNGIPVRRRPLIEFEQPDHMPDGIAADGDTIWVASPFSRQVLAVTHTGVLRAMRSFDSMPYSVACNDDTVFVGLADDWRPEECRQNRSGQVIALPKF